MAYLTQTMLESELGADLVSTLTGGSAQALAACIADATARVRSALVVGGYTGAVPETVYAVDASDCPRAIVDLTIRQWRRVAHMRRGIPISKDELDDITEQMRLVRTGEVEIDGVARSTSRAPGGVASTEASLVSTSADARPPIFSRSRMVGF